MGVIDTLGVVLPLAHELGVPHQEPQQPSGDGGGASPLLVGGGVAATLAITGGLIWVRERSRKADALAALQGDAHADRDEQGAGPALEPGDHARPRQEPA
jgi:hypothetical protein